MPDYDSEAGLLSHLQKQNQNAAQFKNEVGADTDDLASIAQDTANLEFFIELAPIADEFKTSVFGVKKKLIRGAIGEPLGTIMAAPETTAPHPLVAGIERRSRERDQRFKRSKTMTEAALIGMDLNDTPAGIAPETVKPTIEAFPAAGNYEFALVVANRGASDMYDAQIRRKGQETWQTVKSATGKSVNVQIEPTSAGAAEQIQVRVQLKKKDAAYGQPSDPTYVTVNP